MAKKKVAPKPVVLNPEQKAVVEAGNGFYRTLAGPGSGKSECLVQRYVRLVQSGVLPQDILSLTFTNSSAKQMRDRAEAIIPVQKMDRVSGWMTFHSLALQFCAQERDHFPFKLAESVLALEPVAAKIANDVARKYEMDYRTLRPYISLQKRNRTRPNDALRQAEKEGKGEKQALAYKMYDAKLREIGQLDFDSLLVEMVDLLSTPPRGQETSERFSLTQRWQYRFIMSDESQDNDSLQWALLRLMSQEHQNLLAVGDSGQNLYSFRGSSSEMFMGMGKSFPGTQTLFLAKNHRSTPQVTSFCKAIGPVPELSEKFYSTNPDGPEPIITGFPSSVDEAKAVTVAALQIANPNEMCVISRTNRCLRVIEDQFSTEGVKYWYLGKSGFWSQPEIKSVIGYLQCAIFPSDAAVLTALRAPFHPSRYIKKTELAAKIKNKSEELNVIQFLSRYPDEKVRGFVHFLDGLRRYRDLMPNKALGSVLQDLRALDYYKEEESADNSPIDNIQELTKIAGRFSSVKEFLDYTRRASAASKQKKGVCLSTIHAAKGAEWDTVYVIAVQDGILPHAKAESPAEEANCFFVAASRAKTHLHISYSGIPSVFLTPFLKKKEDLALEEVFA